MQGMGSREKSHCNVSSRKNADAVSQVMPSEAPTRCHPELDSGSGFDFISA